MMLIGIYYFITIVRDSCVGRFHKSTHEHITKYVDNNEYEATILFSF